MDRDSTRLIVISGIDGSGKSSHMAWVAAALAARGSRCHYVRLRFAALTSLPLLALARLLGYAPRSRNSRSDTIVIRHLYHRWPVMHKVWPPLFSLDMAVMAWGQVLLPLSRGDSVLCDRFVLDAIVDVAAMLKDERLLDSDFARRLMRLVPARARTLVLDIDPSVAFHRKLDVPEPSFLASRRPMYLRLAERTGAPVVDGNRSFREVQEAIAAIVGVNPLPEHRGVLPVGIS